MGSARATLKGNAYAVIDTTGKRKFNPIYDIYFSLKHARQICNARRSSAFPLTPGAEWKVVKLAFRAC